MRKYIIGGLIGFVLATAASANAEEVTRLIDQVVQGVFPVTVEGASIGEAVVIDNKTYLPVREFGEAVGYTVSFTENREVVLTKNSEPTIPTPTEPVVTTPVTTVNPRIAEINKELEELSLRIKNNKEGLEFTLKTISDFEKEIEATQDDRKKKELESEIKNQNYGVESAKQRIQLAESEIAKLQDELKTLQP